MSDYFQKSQLLKKIKRNKKILIIILLLLNIIIPGILISSSVYSLNSYDDTVYTKKDTLSSDFIAHQHTVQTIESLQREVEVKKEQERRELEREQNIQKAEAILKRYNSPMQGYGEIIIRRAEECGGDFRTLLAIAGNESGFGRIPYKLYNPYGYLDGRQYGSWSEALEFLSCVISQRFIAPCNNDIACIVRTYGGSDTDKPKWIYNINWFREQI